MSKLYDKYFNDEKKDETEIETINGDTNIEVAKLTDEVLSNIGDNQENMNVSTHENDIHISKIGDNQKNINFNGNKVDYEINKIEDKKENSNASAKTIQGPKNSKAILIVMCIIFTIVGAFLMYLGVSKTIKYLSFEEVEAEIVYVRTYRSTGRKSTLMAVPTYEFVVDGVTYRVESSTSVSANLAPRVGDKEKIKYNPNDPEEIVNFSWTIIIFYVMGAIFGGVGITLLILVLKGKVQFSPTNKSNKTIVNSYR